MRYNKIRKMDIANGPGVRVSIFLQGCAFNCKNCFNPETHDFNGGTLFDEDVCNEVINLCDNENVRGLSILGGEPLHPNNIEATTMLSKAFKEKFKDTDKDVWVWTGYTFENIKDKNALKYIDVLIDGQYVDELHSPLLNWRGSSNQRIINVQESLEQNKVVLFDKYYEKQN